MCRSLALAAMPWVVACMLAMPAAHAFAGSVCGTVRDAATLAPVPRAGIFLYQANTYTGLHGATDTGGAYCIDGVPAGIYDLEVRVDDHQTAWVAGIAVNSGATSVDIGPSRGFALGAPWPNPASSAVSFRVSAAVSAPMELRIYDMRGRFVKGWTGPLDASGQNVTWNLLDHSGRRAPAGVYLAQLRVGDETITRTFLCSR